MKPTRIRRIAATLTITAAALTGSLLTAGPAAADNAAPTETVTGPADTWWGAPPSDQPAADEEQLAAAPMDTWWG